MMSTSKPPNVICCAGLLMTAALAALSGCTHTVKVEPIEVKPIEITLHIYLEADQKLDDFFGDIESSTTKTPETSSEGTK